MSEHTPATDKTCAEVEEWVDDLQGELNAVRVWLAKQGYAVDKERPLLHDVRAALRGES